MASRLSSRRPVCTGSVLSTDEKSPTLYVEFLPHEYTLPSYLTTDVPISPIVAKVIQPILSVASSL